MAEHLHECSVDELDAACKALTRATRELDALKARMNELGDSEAAYQLEIESNRISDVHGVLLLALRNRKKEDRERAYVEGLADRATETYEWPKSGE